MARLLLLVPPLHQEELYAGGAKSIASVLPPLGLAYMASYLRERGHQVKIIDGLVEPLPESEICRQAGSYDLVGISVVSTYAVKAISLIKALKGAEVEAPVVVGGPHVSALPEAMIEFGADYSVVGEGEHTLLELVECLEDKSKPVSEVAGLVYRDGDQMVHTAKRELVDPLDEIPLPARDLLPMEKYNSSVGRTNRTPSLSMLSSRGCAGVCSFCMHRTFGNQVRYFSKERIIEEMFLLRDKYGARDVALYDDNFLLNRELAISVCEELIRRDFGITWSLEARVDSIDPELLGYLKRANCGYIAYGIESGSQRLLDYMNKRTTLEQIRHAVSITKKAGIPTRGYFIVGFPGETLAEMQQTVDFALELDMDAVSFTLLLPMPGTLEYKRALKSGTFVDPEYFHNRVIPEFNFPHEALYLPDGVSAEKLLALHRRAYHRFYFRPRKVLSRLLSVRSAGEIKIILKAANTLLQSVFESVIKRKRVH